MKNQLKTVFFLSQAVVPSMRSRGGGRIAVPLGMFSTAGMTPITLPRTRNGSRFLPLAVYLLMGWLCVIALGPLLQRLPTAGFVLLLSGGLCYTSGIGFYLYDSRFRHFHGIWHLFVLAGSISHFWAILRYLD
jgi:hemolysin III